MAGRMCLEGKKRQSRASDPRFGADWGDPDAGVPCMLLSGSVGLRCHSPPAGHWAMLIQSTCHAFLQHALREKTSSRDQRGLCCGAEGPIDL